MTRLVIKFPKGPRTLLELIEDSKKLENGIKPESEVFDVDYKIGDIKNCHKCGNPTESVVYNGCMQFSKNCIVTCDKCYENPIEKTEIPHKHDKCCEQFCLEEHYLEEEIIRLRRAIIKKILNAVKPTSDSILQYDKLCYITAGIFYHDGSDEWEFWLYHDFMNYCGLHGLLTLSQKEKTH